MIRPPAFKRQQRVISADSAPLTVVESRKHGGLHISQGKNRVNLSLPEVQALIEAAQSFTAELPRTTTPAKARLMRVDTPL